MARTARGVGERRGRGSRFLRFRSISIAPDTSRPERSPADKVLRSHNRERWLSAPRVPDSFVCNVGDMLERLTAGRYVSALHRVRNVSTRDRISMPLFLDPSFDAVLAQITALAPDLSATDRHRPARRWDGTDLATVSGTYGEYLLNKVSKVFQELRAKVL